MIYKTLYRILQIEQQESITNLRWTHVLNICTSYLPAHARLAMNKFILDRILPDMLSIVKTVQFPVTIRINSTIRKDTCSVWKIKQEIIIITEESNCIVILYTLP